MARSGSRVDRQVDAVVVKRVLMVGYHFPPIAVSSGVQRMLRFTQYLPKYGWQPTVLTVHPRAYSVVSDLGMNEIPARLAVRRAFALDTASHLSLRGAYPRMLAIPDRWWTWCIGAVPAGLAEIRKTRPHVLWTTYPIATAHLIGYVLHRLTGIPWVADFRDPMAQENYPENALEHRAYEWIERRTFAHCARSVFTAPGAERLYADRYPQLPASTRALIENGYDESVFGAAEKVLCRSRHDDGPVVLVHSGTIYASERDPRCFLAALGCLRRNGSVTGDTLKVVLRATGCDKELRRLIVMHGLEPIVAIAPAVPYSDALAEMLTADGLLILQAANCNYQIPAKVYEYMRAGRPILALTDPAGDTASLLRASGIDTIAPLDSQEAIAVALIRFIQLVRDGEAPIASLDKVREASREARTAQLAEVLKAAIA